MLASVLAATGTIVDANQKTAQIMFLIAVIIAGISIFVGFVQREWAYYNALWALVLFFLSLGLLFHA